MENINPLYNYPTVGNKYKIIYAVAYNKTIYIWNSGNELRKCRIVKNKILTEEIRKLSSIPKDLNHIRNIAIDWHMTFYLKEIIPNKIIIINK